MDDGGKFVRTGTNVKLSLLNKLWMPYTLEGMQLCTHVKLFITLPGGGYNIVTNFKVQLLEISCVLRHFCDIKCNYITIQQCLLVFPISCVAVKLVTHGSTKIRKKF